jgi:endonuclease/exonuclease/phosphatase family metal-dependent hydrolase
MALRVLTWNLFHGRSVPETRHSLLDAFAATLAGFEWDVALLQEVPPWWPVPLARAAHASERMALTSRNILPALQRMLAEARPDILKSWAGGANAILVRGQAIREHRVQPLRLLPERRVAHGVRLEDGTWLTNLHATVHLPPLAQADLDLAGTTTTAWAAGAPTVLGGDLNLHGTPAMPGYEHLAGNSVDHVLGRGLRVVERARTLDRGTLSDHAPLTLVVEPADAVGTGGGGFVAVRA